MAAIICVLLIIATFFIKPLQKSPINWAVYGLFTLSFAHLWAFLCCWDKSRYLYFVLVMLTAIAVSYAIYAFISNYYMSTIGSLLVAFAAAAVVLIGFVVFSKMNHFYLWLIFAAVVIFGFYIAYDVRRMLRYSLMDSSEKDPVSGAVSIWAEGCLVFCRLGELVGNIFRK